MSFSDLLTTASILLSIIFGFFITHWQSIKDTRTRVLKDYYIEQLKGIKGRMDKFFHQVAWGKSSSNKIRLWYTHICMDVASIDSGLRKSLDMHIVPFGDKLSKCYSEITSWDDYNDQFSHTHYQPNVQHIQDLLVMMQDVDDFLNEYIDHINQANTFSIWKIQVKKIKQNQRFYSDKRKSIPFARAVGERIGKHFWELLFSALIIGGFIYVCFNLKNDTPKVDLTKPLNNIAEKQDSICSILKELKDKYKPVEVHQKTFKNSSFFSADNIDSLNVRLYQNK